MKTPKKSLAALALIIVVACLLQYDDELSTDAKKMLESTQWQQPSKAYLYFLGFGARLEDDPIEEGKKVLLKIRTSESSYSDNSFEEAQLLEYQAPLSIPDHELFCSLSESGCIDKLFSSSEFDLDNEIYKVVAKRYIELLNIQKLHSLTRPYFNEYIPNYSPLVKANRLVSLNAIHKAQDCCANEATNDLYKLIELQKDHLKQSDTLIDKVIRFVLINDTIEVLSMLLRKYDLEGKILEPLSKEELSFNKAMSREYALARSYLLVTARSDKWKWVPGWAERMTIKENMSSNASAPFYRYIVELSESPQLEFSGLLEHSQKIKTAWIRNFFGTILNQVAVPSFHDYVARGFDINAKISLFNGTLGNRITFESLNSIENPYYENRSMKATIDTQEKRACFTGPLEDSRFTRCLNLVR